MILALMLATRMIAASGDWVAFDHGATCAAVTRSQLAPRKREPQPHLSLSFDRGGGRRGELGIALRRPIRAGSSVVLTIGEQPFLLAARGPNAWSRGAAQEAAIIAAIRAGTGMRVEARDSAGRRMTDRYVLNGAPTAIDAAAAACLRPMRP